MSDKIEAAKSSRSKCGKCGEKILKGVLRFGEEYQSEYGQSFRWYHLPCAAQKLPSLFGTTLEAFGGDVPDREVLDALLSGASGTDAPPLPDYPDVSMAPTGRASCMQCGTSVEKGTERISVETDVVIGGRTRLGAGYMHPACVPAWLGLQDEVDPAEFNRGLVAKGGTSFTVDTSAVDSIPSFGGKTGAELLAFSRSLRKFADEYKTDALVHEFLGTYANGLFWHLAEAELLPLDKRVDLLHNLVKSSEHHGDVGTALRVLRKLPANHRHAHTRSAMVLPEWTYQHQYFAAWIWQTGPELVRDQGATFKPNVRVGMHFTAEVFGESFPSGDGEGLARALAAELGEEWPLKTTGPGGDEVHIDLEAMAIKVAGEAFWTDLCVQRLRSEDYLRSVRSLRLGFVHAPVEVACEALARCYDRSNSAQALDWIHSRDDQEAFMRVAQSVEDGKVRVMIYSIQDALPEGAEDALTFEDIYRYTDTFMHVLKMLGPERSAALARRELARDPTRCGWIALHVQAHDIDHDMLDVCIDQAMGSYVPNAAVHAVEPLRKRLERPDASADLRSLAARTLRGLVAQGHPIPAWADTLLFENDPEHLRGLVEHLEAQRATALVHTLMHIFPPEKVLVRLEAVDRALQKTSVELFFSRRKKIKTQRGAGDAVEAIPNIVELLAPLMPAAAGEKKFFKQLAKGLDDDDYDQLVLASGGQPETTEDKLTRLAVRADKMYWTLLLDERKAFPKYAVESHSYTGPTPPPGVEVPQGEHEPMEHVLTLDLSAVPDLAKEYGSPTLSLFVESPDTGEFNENATLTKGPALEGIPSGCSALNVAAVEFRSKVRWGAPRAVGWELRQILSGVSGFAFGPGVWVQESEGRSVTLQLNDAYINLGDAGSLYIGGFGSVFQCL